MKTDFNGKILSDLKKGYDLVAEKFSETRAFMWRDLEFMKNMVNSGDRVLDFGCGNGRLAGFLENDYKEFVGVDISSKLISIAKQKYSNQKTKFIKISAQFKKLPFRDNYFDIVFSIAVFHHFPSREYSLQTAKELYWVLRPGGRIIITVWNLWQERFLKYRLGLEKSAKSERLGKWENVYIPFRAHDKIFHRYHHPFKIRELGKIFQETGFKKIKKEEGRNLLYIGEK